MICMIAMVLAVSAEPAFALSKAAFQKQTARGVKVMSVNYNTVNVSWDRVSGASGYEVYAAKHKIGRYYKVGTVTRGSTDNIGIGKCVTGKKYFFKVRAYHKTGTDKYYTKYSKVVSGKAKLAKPAMTLWLPIGTDLVRISHKKVTGANGYEIWRKAAGGKYKLIKTTKSSVLSYDDKSIKKGTTYYYRVRAFRRVEGKKVYGPYGKVKKSVVASRNGNASKYDISNITAGNSLAGLEVVFLGSSVTRGKYSDSQSFADILMKKDGVSGGYKNLASRKFAVNGTTLVDNGPKSYISRMKNAVQQIEGEQPGYKPDFLVCQLSTNDSRVKNKIGTVTGASTKLSAYDTGNVTGAIEYIAAYVKQTYKCPVIFYVVPEFTSNYFHDDHYAKMRKALLNVKKSWDGHAADANGRVLNEAGDRILILDFWGDPDYAPNFGSERNFYMVDSVHPTKAGYVLKYVPAFERFLKAMQELNNKGDADGAEGADGADDVLAPDSVPVQEDGAAPDDGAGSGADPDREAAPDGDAVQDSEAAPGDGAGLDTHAAPGNDPAVDGGAGSDDGEIGAAA